MEKNDNQKYKLVIAILSILLLVVAISLSLVYNDNMNLGNQVQVRDSLIIKTIIKDSLLSKQKTKADRIIEKYINDCGIVINDKKVTTAELLDYIYSQNDLVSSLKLENNALLDSLNIYKSYIELSKRNLNVDYGTRKANNKIIASLAIKGTDSLTIYKKLYELMKRDYGISYNFSTKENSTYYIKNYSKLDSALFLYEHYSYVLSGDTLGNICIQLPSKKEKKRIENQNKRKLLK